MTLVVALLLAISVIVLGATAPKPTGWVVVALAVLALLLALFGAFPIRT